MRVRSPPQQVPLQAKTRPAAVHKLWVIFIADDCTRKLGPSLSGGWGRDEGTEDVGGGAGCTGNGKGKGDAHTPPPPTIGLL